MGAKAEVEIEVAVRYILEDITSLPAELRLWRHHRVDRVVSAPNPLIDRALNALPRRTIVADGAEQVLLLRSNSSRRVHQAIEV